ncbi:MAG: excinuclease ABC subunit A [Planctomycetota bacterium]|nr:MAG: excinuclease ABC subunit A [Planctomycetota bacterium]
MAALLAKSSGTGVPDLHGFTADDAIVVRGARVHNLRDVDVAVPRGKLVVITGVSGSGKSSLAFDTLFAEGQRQYIESLSAAARQYIDQIERPDVDLIEGLQPTIAIDQRVGGFGPRSTVATATEIYDYLRVLYARVGQVECFRCGTPIRQQSPEQIVEAIGRLGSGARGAGLGAREGAEEAAKAEGVKAMLLAPMVRGRRGKHDDVLSEIRKAGFVRVRIDGEVFDVERPGEIDPKRTHDIEAVVDRVVIRGRGAGLGARGAGKAGKAASDADSRLAESVELALKHGDGALIVAYAEKFADQDVWHDAVFSTKYACPKCGTNLAEIEPRTFSFNSPYGACPACEGLGKRRPLDASGVPIEDEDFEDCPACKGTRLRPEARAVRIGRKGIHEVGRMAVGDAAAFFAALAWSDAERPIAEPLVTEIARRRAFLEKVGVEYLTLDRAADTLSGGELQRVRLATCIGSGLVGVCYVLDEPSIGLHPRDNARLIAALRELQQQGNTVVVVEHDEAIVREADWIIDVGPGAGRHGGEIVAVGTPNDIAANTASLTGDYLGGRKKISRRSERRKVARSRAIVLEGASANNLQDVTATFPLGVLTCVTGVSGSGKSTLLVDTLAPAILRRLNGASNGGPRPAPFTSLRGVNLIEKFVLVDQAPIGRTPRSSPATYSGVWDEIRRVFAATREAKRRGYKASRFSFNTPGGRCEACAGQGRMKIEMNFLPDLFVPCNECGGRRFDRATLQVRFREKSIADVLDMPAEEAAAFFDAFESIHRVFASLVDVGLGYLPIGQPSTTLSGGEAQRVKLGTELARVEAGSTLYLLDEPTTGLHLADIDRLMNVLQRLVDRGNTVIVIEHHADVIAAADWVVELGPGGGASGGRVVFEGEGSGDRG